MASLAGTRADDAGWGYYQDISPYDPSSAISEFKDMDLDDLIGLADTLEENPERDPEQLKLYTYAHYYTFLKTRLRNNLDRAMASLQELLDRIGSNDPYYENHLKDLVVMNVKLYEYNKSVNQLDLAICRAQELLVGTDYLHAERYLRWDGVVRMLKRIASVTGDSSLLNEMTEGAGRTIRNSAKMMIEYSDQGNPQNLAVVPDSKKKEYIQRLKEAIAVCSPEAIQRGMFLDVAAGLAHQESLRTMDPADLNEAITLNEMSVAFYNEQGDPFNQKEQRITALAILSLLKFNQQTRDMKELNRAIKIFQESLIGLGRESRTRSVLFHGLHDALSMRFKAFGRLSDGERAVRIMERRLDQASPTELNWPLWLNMLSVDLSELFKHKAGKTSFIDMESLDRIVAIGLEVLEYIRQGDPSRVSSAHFAWDWLNEISNHFCLRYQYKGDPNDLNFSIQMGEEATQPRYRLEALSATPQLLFNLGSKLERRYELLGDPQDLDKLISVVEDALALVNTNQHGIEFSDWTFKSAVLDLLQRGLLHRFRATGDDDVFEEVVRRSTHALALCPDDGDIKDIMLNNLANTWAYRFDRVKKVEYIDQAMALHRQALAIVSVESGRRALYCFSLACCFESRYTIDPIKFHDDIDDAILYALEAQQRLPKGHFEAAKLPSVLGRFYFTKWEQTQSPTDLEAAISHAREAVRLCGPDGPNTAEHKLNLAKYIWDGNRRQKQTPADFTEAAQLCTEGMKIAESPARIRLQCAIVAADCFYYLGKANEIAEIGEQAIRLLPTLSSRALKQRDQQRLLKQFSSITRRAVGAAFEVGKSAAHCLELLEFGRGIINGLRFDSRTSDVTSLQNQYPQLAKKFLRIRDALDNAVSTTNASVQTKSPGQDFSLDPEINRKHNLTKAFNDIVEQIRGLPGYRGFMQPPRAEDLRTVSKSQEEAVVALNVGSSRCDAIILQNGEIRQLPLPDLKEEDIEKNVIAMRSMRMHPSGRRKLTVILAWLWKTAVGPILDNLGFTTPPDTQSWPRVWWVATGALTQLPLHAAGYKSDSLLDRAVSSYSSSVKALLYSRRARSGRSGGSHKVLLASMPKTDGASDLEYADREVDALTDILQTNVTVEKLREPSKAHLRPELRSCTVFHFAGHGMSDPDDPAKSLLLLKDWKTDPFTANELINLNLHDSEHTPWLAYLSACSTGESQDATLYDESIHLMSACHSAGFRHVIGSLWEVSDMYSVEVAKCVYGDLKSNLGAGRFEGNVALALHKAVRKLRDTTIALGAKGSAVEKEDMTSDSEIEEELSRAISRIGLAKDGDDATRGTRGANVERAGKAPRMGDPLTWAAYIHVGL